jgi:heme/copper-type cytochrome/quinol oxidase subunit 2
MKKAVIYLFIIILSVSFTPVVVKAQCSMCTINAEQGTQNGNTQGKGLNSGIIYLLAIPYLLITGMGIIWYRTYRKKISTVAD